MRLNMSFDKILLILIWRTTLKSGVCVRKEGVIYYVCED